MCWGCFNFNTFLYQFNSIYSQLSPVIYCGGTKAIKVNKFRKNIAYNNIKMIKWDTMKYLPNCESYLKVFFLIMNSFCQLLICFIWCYTLCGLVVFFFFPSLFSFSLLKTIRWSIPFYKQGNRDSWWMSQLAEGHVIGTECRSKVTSVFYPLHFLSVLLERHCSKWGNGFQR